MIIGIYGSRRQHDSKEAIVAFINTLLSKGVDLVIHRKLFDSLSEFLTDNTIEVTDTSDFYADVVLSFGGDGTFLRTAMWVGSKEIPILGINTGHLGYLTTARAEDLCQVIDELLEGRYTVEDRSLLHVVSPSLETWPYALNEVVVSKHDTSSMVVADTEVNGKPIGSYRADGLIIATPTGSTAYNLSVGGPVVQPSAPVWVISPISAHSLSMRPFVLSDDSHISVNVTSRASSFRLTLDGRTGTLPVGTTVSLRRAPFVVRVICRHGYEFPHALRTKLFWGI